MTVRGTNAALVSYLVSVQAMTAEQGAMLIDGVDHPYSCTCDTCREFWRMVGPDEKTGMYGPLGYTLDGERSTDND